MSTDDDIQLAAALNKASRTVIREFDQAPVTLQDYRKVSSLLITWEYNDLVGIDKEIRKLERLFRKDYNFATKEYKIPNENPQMMLQRRLTDFVLDSSKEGSLIIVYYGGHGDMIDGKSVWAATENEHGPLLYWHQVQQTVFSGKGDVLIILDCCHAAAAVRGASFSSLRKVEIIAASGLHRMTPAPGPKSFTALLTEILKDVFDPVNPRKEISASQIVRKLIDLSDTRIKETAYHASLTSTAENNTGSIVLKRYIPPDPPGFEKRPVGSLILHATLTSDPTGQEIAAWLKRNLPSSIGSIDIAGLVVQAHELQTTVKSQSGELNDNSIFGKLSDAARGEILNAMAPVEDTISELNEERKSNAQVSEAQVAKKAEKLKSAVANAEKEIQAAILLEGGLQDTEKQDILKAQQDKQRFIIDPAAVELQDVIEKGIPSSLAVDRSSIKYATGALARSERMRIATFKRDGKEITVLIEFVEFDEDSPSRQEQFRTVAKRLSIRPRMSANLTLEGLGYLDEPNLSRSGLVFRLPETFSPRLPVSLYQLYADRRTVPLEDRISLAYKLAIALDNLHIVGWLHKDITSRNVFFFFPPDYPKKTEDGSELDVESATPYFFGFEYSRHESAESSLASDFSVEANTFRHPQRWGKPTVKFTKVHDIYSLGVLLFEIGLWTKIDAVVAKMQKERRKLNEKTIRNYILKKTEEEIPHWVGKRMAKAIRACIEFEALVKDKSEVERRIIFRKEILENLQL